MEHMDPSLCNVEMRLLCLMSTMSLAFSAAIILLLV